MEAYKKQATFTFNNYFQLKRSLHGNKDRRRMLVKLRKDLRKLGLSKRARRVGLMQLAVRPCVVLERLPVSSYKEKSLQSLHNNNKNFMTSYKESQYEHRDDAQKRRIEDSQDLHQQSNIQILSAAETASINTLDASKTCRNEEQGCNLLEKELSKPREKIINLIQDFTQKATKKNSHIDVTSTKHMGVSEKLDIKAACSLSSSKDELLKKQNFTHKFANKNSCSESKINFSKDRSISVPAKKMNIFVNEECSSLENESSDTTVPLRLTKHCSDPKRSINSSEDANVFARQHKKNISSLKTKLDTLQECSNESRIVNISSECNISSSNIISEATANDFTNENENVQLDLELVKHIDTSLQYKGIRKNIRQTKINSKSKNLSTVNLHIGTNSKVVIKRKVSSRSSDQNALPIKIRKKNEINTSPDKVVPHSNIEIFKYKLDHTNQRIRGYIIRYKKRENYKSRKRKKDKYKTKREKLQKYFEGSFDSNTSETEENSEILLNYRKRRKQESDDLLHDDKKLTHDTNLQRNIEGINFNNSYDFTTNFEKCATHDATTDTEIEDEASIDKRVTLANNKQENVESDNSDNSCDSTACTEKCYAIYNAADEVGEASTRENETSVNNSQENTEDISSDNLCDSSASTEEDCAVKDAATKIEAKDGALVCTYDTSSVNSQKNIDIVIFLDKVKSDDSCDSTVTEKYFMHDATIDEKIEGRPGKHGTCANNSQINIEDAQSVKENCNNSCDFTASSEECYTTFDEYATDEIEDRRASIRKRDTFANNSQKNITESTILAKTKSDNSCNCTVNTEKNYATPDTMTEKKIVEPSIAEASICIRDMSANNSQKSIENAESIKENSDSSCDSTTNIEIHSMHDTATDEKVENRASKYISSTSANDSQENKRNAIPVKKQRVVNFLSIVATENNSKSDTRAEQSKDNDLSTIEIVLDENTSDMEDRNIDKQADMTCMPILQNQQENQEICNSDSVDLTQDTRRRAISNLELPIAFANDSALCNVNEKDSRGMSQTIKNLLKSNDILKDGKTSLDEFLMTTSEKNSLERRHDESSFVQTTNSSTSLSQSNCNDNHSSDDDNSNNIEVEINIKPKLKFQISQKFSLKASSSAVNSYIENLYTLKNNPNFLNEIFEINHKSSERSKETITSKRPENNMSLSDNQNITAETEEIVYDSVFTVKDNAKCSQQQNFQDSPILKEDENAMDSNQRERNKCMQPVKTTTQITTENNSVSSELACGMSNLEKQIHDASTGDKRKINEEQHSQDNTITKKIKSERVHNQQKDDKNASFIERKKIQIADNPEGIKTAYNMPDLGQQLPQTFLDVTHSKVRSITEINCQCAMKFSSLNASNIRKCVCLKICQSAHSKSVSSQSTSHRSESLQLTSQSTLTQSTPHPSVSSQVTPTQSALSISSQLPSSQTALPLLILSQLARTQSVPCASVPVQLAPTQSTLRPSVPFQVAPPLLILSQLAPTQSAPRPSLSFQVAPTQSAPRVSVSFQLVRIQSAPRPSVSSQLAPTQSTLRPSVPFQVAPPLLILSQLAPTQSALRLSLSFQVAPTQSAPRVSVSFQFVPIQSAPRPSVSSQLAPTQSTLRPSVPFQVAPPLLILSQLAPIQSAPRPSLSFQVVPTQSAPRVSVFFQLVPIQSAPRPSVSSQLAPTQSVSCPLVFSQLSSAQSAPTPSTVRSSISPYLTSQPTSRPSVRPQLISQSASDPSVSLQSTHLQLISQLISKLPSYDTAINQIHFSSRTNAPVTPVAPVEINTPNVNNERTNYNYTFQIIMKSLYDHIKYCRNFIRHTRIRHVTIELTEKMYVHVKQIDLNLEKLKILLCTKDTQDVLVRF
ncbi:uncharacterized protein MAL13P1.304 [Solenopsis invicta]|uniref:uncharacterized protein MAL13P1.304 n=1 Tax=Solenopsis invicta TaxID=13686 RepID=UPI00193C919B|nr:uncharacterized protein MAL13P1.304 [Solenopsis invicta]